jgi:HK97 family phage major capsid protein
MDGATLRLFAQLQDSTGDKQFYMGLTDLPGPFTDDPSAEGTIYRRPVYEVPFTAGTVWFGDPTQAYIIGTVDGLVSAVSDQVKFAEDQVMWKLTQRFDGNNIDAAASQVATGITTVTSVIV